MRIYAHSDVHVDYAANRECLAALSVARYGDAGLILAGDVSHDLDRVAEAFALLRARFGSVAYVPGNHELWVRDGDAADSMAKLEQLLELARAHDVATEPVRWGSAWVVPLHSWYTKPEQGEDSLYLTKPGEDASLRMWSDEVFLRWPAAMRESPAQHMLARNRAALRRDYDAPVITFSHFLPRADLIRRTQSEIATEAVQVADRLPAFNFSRVAGTAALDVQIRQLGARIHVYGHQHRNRDRVVDGVRYVSHCLGYPSERRHGAPGPGAEQPLLIWPPTRV